MTFQEPIILMTRPSDASTGFVTLLEERCLGPLVPIVSPVFCYETVGGTEEIDYDEVIFTSAQAVAFAGAGRQRTAWCVGQRTAQKASQAGFQVQSADGDAKALLALIRSTRPHGRMMHLRGEVSRGDICQTLRAEGMRCDERIVYRKKVADLTAEAVKALCGEDDIVLPLFSPETATILAKKGPFRAPLHIVAMSAAVVQSALPLNPASIVTAKSPTQSEMVALVAGLIA